MSSPIFRWSFASCQRAVTLGYLLSTVLLFHGHISLWSPWSTIIVITLQLEQLGCHVNPVRQASHHNLQTRANSPGLPIPAYGPELSAQAHSLRPTTPTHGTRPATPTHGLRPATHSHSESPSSSCVTAIWLLQPVQLLVQLDPQLFACLRIWAACQREWLPSRLSLCQTRIF